MEDLNKITYFGETDSRNKRLRFGIKDKDRARHMYVIGKTGMGKSTLLENMAIQDIQNGNGIAFIDPHGKTADLLMEYVPEHRIKDVLYLAPFDLEHPVSFNVLEDVGYDKRHLVSSGLMSAFKKIWVDAWSARMEYILTNILLALLEYPDATLIGVNRMLADKDYRKKVVDNITDPAVKSFWVDEYAKYTDKFAAEAAPAIQNKIGQFIANPLIRNIIGQSKSSFDIREMMDQKKIIIINLSKGRMGEVNANLLGSMLITKIYLAAMSRADVPEPELKKLPSFYLYVDEFQNFANESFADILSEARKYKLALTVAHQYIEQMTDEVRAAVFGNVGTMVTYRVGSYDAEVFEKEFAPQFMKEDLVNLGRFQMYLRLMIDEVGSQPFSATGMAPIPKPNYNFVREIIESSRKQFAQPRAKVEGDIKTWHESGSSSAKQDKAPSKPGEFKPAFNTATATANTARPSSRPILTATRAPVPSLQVQPTPRPIVQKPATSDFKTPRPEFVKPKEHQPFKVVLTPEVIVQKPIAIEKEVVPVQVTLHAIDPEIKKSELPQAVSLNYLKRNVSEKISLIKKIDKKGVTPESMSHLRDALKDILKQTEVSTSIKENIEQANSNASSQGPTIKKVTIEHTKEEKVSISDTEKPKGIPEDELRKMLEVE